MTCTNILYTSSIIRYRRDSGKGSVRKDWTLPNLPQCHSDKPRRKRKVALFAETPTCMEGLSRISQLIFQWFFGSFDIKHELKEIQYLLLVSMIIWHILNALYDSIWWGNEGDTLPRRWERRARCSHQWRVVTEASRVQGNTLGSCRAGYRVLRGLEKENKRLESQKRRSPTYNSSC